MRAAVAFGSPVRPVAKAPCVAPWSLRRWLYVRRISLTVSPTHAATVCSWIPLWRHSLFFFLCSHSRVSVSRAGCWNDLRVKAWARLELVDSSEVGAGTRSRTCPGGESLASSETGSAAMHLRLASEFGYRSVARATRILGRRSSGRRVSKACRRKCPRAVPARQRATHITSDVRRLDTLFFG